MTTTTSRDLDGDRSQHTSQPPSEGATTLISAATAVSRLAHGADPIIIDGSLELAEARYDGDYRATSGRNAWIAERIPGSRHVDLLSEWIDPSADYHFAAPDPRDFSLELGRAGIDGSRAIWLYDRTNLMWASRLWWTLRNAGIPALVIDGGLAGWKAVGGEVELGEPLPGAIDPVSPPATTDRGVWVGRTEVEAVLHREDPKTPLLVCALSADAMWGRVPTRYTRRGHIPGSLNVAGHLLLDPAGSLLGGPGPLAVAGQDLALHRPVIVYCGGGISASLTALALVHWGFTNVRIYDGSLEEWSSRPELKLVRT